MAMRSSKASKASEKPKKSVSIRPKVSVINDTTIILPKPALKKVKKPEECPDVASKKKREEKADRKKAVEKDNPEEDKHQDASQDKADVPVKRIRKASGTFPSLPPDSVMKAKGLAGLTKYQGLYIRIQAPVMFKEGERPYNQDKMEVHQGIEVLMKKLIESCKPSGQSTLLHETLLQHWFNTVQTSVSTREYFVVKLLLDDIRRNGTDSSRSHISREAKHDDRQCHYCMKMMGNFKPWTHVNCWDKEPKSVLKFYSHRKFGFVCPSCYTSGYTLQKLCVHLMDNHSVEDFIKMGVSTIHIARGPAALTRQERMMPSMPVWSTWITKRSGFLALKVAKFNQPTKNVYPPCPIRRTPQRLPVSYVSSC